MKYTFKKLVNELCKREKLKKQVDVAQVSELIGHLADIIFEGEGPDDAWEYDLSDMLFYVGEKRAKKKLRLK